MQEQVTKDEGKKLAEKLGANLYQECSALTQEGLRELFRNVNALRT